MSRERLREAASSGTGETSGMPPRLALSKAEAACSLGVSVDYFEQHVQPELRIVYRGRRRLIPVGELQRWLNESAVRAGGGGD